MAKIKKKLSEKKGEDRIIRRGKRYLREKAILQG